MQSLSVKYRPKTFEEVVGQESIIKILNRQLELNEIKNVYLFCGPSGTGKTTLCRALASRINKGLGSPIEIDAASNNGVDNIRDIIKAARERSLDSEYKIYIIDEVHALSNSAWQALLKLIEEPPTYTIFMLATTDPQKIPATVINRCMRFNLTRISSDKIKERLEYICEQEGFTNYNSACDYISRISHNQMRDAIATLEKCASYDTNLDIENVMQAVGSYSFDVFADLVDALLDGRNGDIFNILTYFYNKGNDMKLFVDQFLSFIIDVCKYCICGTINVTKFPVTFEDRIKTIINFDTPSKYYVYLMDKLLELKNMIKLDIDPYSTVQVYFISMANSN